MLNRRTFIACVGAVPLAACGGGGEQTAPTTVIATEQPVTFPGAVRRFYMDGAYDVQPTTASASGPVPAGISMAPAVYSFAGRNYDCSAPGMYVFMDCSGGGLPTFNRRIAAVDVHGVMSALAWGSVAAVGDEPQSSDYSGVLEKWLTRKVAMRCGYQVGFAMWLLTQSFQEMGIRARKVGLFTGEEPNNFSDGHVCIEVYTGGGWRLYDINQGALYASGGQHLNLEQIITSGMVGCDRIALSEGQSYGHGVDGGFDYASFGDFYFRTASDRAEWRRRIFQIPAVMGDDGIYRAYLPDGYSGRREWMEKQKVVIMPKADWLAMFYA